jgi:hypothetical protein
MRFLSPIQVTILARRLSTTISRVVLFDSVDNNYLVSLFQHYQCLCVQDLIDPWTWIFIVGWIWFLQNTRIDEMKKYTKLGDILNGISDDGGLLVMSDRLVKQMLLGVLLVLFKNVDNAI